MKKVLVILLVSIAMCANAQDCKISVDEVDKFTGVHRVETKMQTVFKEAFKDAIQVYAIKNDSSYYIAFHLVENEIFSFTEGSELWLLLDNKEVIKLKAIKDGIAQPYTIVGTTYTMWECTIKYKLSNNDVASLVSHNPNSLRFFLIDGYIDRDIKGKYLSAIKNVVNCIAK